METLQLPWLFVVATAAWFGWMAYRAGRNPVLWAVGGGAFGLVASTIIMGLGRASSLPYSDHEAQADELKWIAVAAVLIIGVGWLLTGSLHRHRLMLEQQARTTPAPAPPLPPEAKTGNPLQAKGPSKPGS